MNTIFCFLICILATTIGAISGIGGGVIIKPVLDALSGWPAATISFLSGCTVLSMSVVSLLRSRGDGVKIEKKQGTLLAAGAAAGGVLGKEIFDVIRSSFGNPSMIGRIQNIIMIFLTAFVLWYQINREKIRSRQVEHAAGCLAIGLMLGLLSAFLGIGGGPVNLAVLYYFFSMETKTAAVNSIYIIFFSQITSLASTLMKGSVPEFPACALAAMITGGILGGFAGSVFSRHLSSRQVDILFAVLLIMIIGISGYNVYHYWF